MCVLVAVNMSEGDAACLYLADLRFGFALNFFSSNPLAH